MGNLTQSVLMQLATVNFCLSIQNQLASGERVTTFSEPCACVLLHIFIKILSHQTSQFLQLFFLWQ